MKWVKILAFRDEDKGESWSLCLTKHNTQTLAAPLRIIMWMIKYGVHQSRNVPVRYILHCSRTLSFSDTNRVTSCNGVPYSSRKPSLSAIVQWLSLTLGVGQSHALLHVLFSRSFFYSYINPIVNVINRSSAIWLYCTALYSQFQLFLQSLPISLTKLSLNYKTTAPSGRLRI
jgi:hypothetical protein